MATMTRLAPRHLTATMGMCSLMVTAQYECDGFWVLPGARAAQQAMRQLRAERRQPCAEGSAQLRA